jgi:hypothetical protein
MSNPVIDERTALGLTQSSYGAICAYGVVALADSDPA